MKDQIATSRPMWVSDIYQPEGTDRPTYNRPVSTSRDDDSRDQEQSLAEIVSELNRRTQDRR